MTEAQAKQLWCPFVRAVRNETKLAEFMTCIGASCMAWRIQGIEELPIEESEPIKVAHGYCGLAGKP